EVAALVASRVITIRISDHPGIELTDRFFGQSLDLFGDRFSTHVRPSSLSRRASTRLPDHGKPPRRPMPGLRRPRGRLSLERPIGAGLRGALGQYPDTLVRRVGRDL